MYLCIVKVKKNMNNLTNINTELLPNEYAEWRKNIEDLIEVSKLRTAINVNTDMLTLYWNIGKSILQKQEERGWGTKVIDQLSKDLNVKFPDDRGEYKWGWNTGGVKAAMDRFESVGHGKGYRLPKTITLYFVYNLFWVYDFFKK